ncbi:MAG: alpha/beta hydrolase [Muricomes sp.]
MNKKRRALIAANEISEMKSYVLNGIPQKVLIEGRKASNPIVVFLHGGPGSPFPFSAGCRGMFAELTSRVTMVYWDQLGCGINDYLIDDSFLIDHFVVMTIDLIKQLRIDFEGCPIHIFAVSWGSILAAKVAAAVPELISRVAIYGQALIPLLSQQEVFDSLEKSDMPDNLKTHLTRLKNQDSEYSIEEFILVLKWLRKYTEGYQSKKGSKLALGGIFRGLLASPDYSLKDIKATIFNGYRKNKSIVKEMMGLELSEILRNIQLPYMIIQGDSDIVTSTKVITEFVRNAGNKYLDIRIIEHSGHIPGTEEMNEIIEIAFPFFGA